ncbi:hypothetical protein [Loktanella sp. SALINAS62]|uniref:hypothetical protein n=1 Tax=Loktanella sp. SALINAS62 TaxID=2706124 RepID=UPI001B8B6312|nr:hypothetical protein [Loktanella sp. SALINAS62]MBS1301047.1 hypothetical protein [Loktanella sp. SALINAS62]
MKGPVDATGLFWGDGLGGGGTLQCVQTSSENGAANLHGRLDANRTRTLQRNRIHFGDKAIKIGALMVSAEEVSGSPQKILFTFLDARIRSCESKRRLNSFFMNSLKLLRVVSGVLAVLFVALLAADGFDREIKFGLNIAAIVSTSLAALGSDISTAFGFETRFKQNVQASGKLRTLKSRLELDISMLKSGETLDYAQWHNTIIEVLDGQSVSFDASFERAHKAK